MKQAQEIILRPAPKNGVAPEDFYTSTPHLTRVFHRGRWIELEDIRMDAAIVVRANRARCVKMRDLRRGDPVICGFRGIEVFPPKRDTVKAAFSFMSNEVSSERDVSGRIAEISEAFRAVRKRKGKIVVVAGPVVIHTGGDAAMARLIRKGWIDAVLAGNALGAHDLELAMFGSSLGVDSKTGKPLAHGHQNHLRAINAARAAGSIAALVKQKKLRSGIFFELIKNKVPFSLAGSIRDDGPLPETKMDLIEAQDEYAKLLRGVDLVLILSSMLHGIGVGNMIPSRVQTICVDINPAVVTKLADRGSAQTMGLVTDVGLFLRQLADCL